MITFIENYAMVLPPWMYFNIVEELLIPKIKRVLEDWKKGWKIHTWVFPWLPVLGKYITEIIPDCRRFLQTFLKKWTPDDDLAYIIIDKWKEVI
jgi:tuftelin-interacting protein 11